MKPYIKHAIALLALLPSLLFAASDIWDGTADITWYLDNRDATEYIIRTAEQLAGLASLDPIVTKGKTVKLGDDIVLNNTEDWENWATSNEELREWTPIEPLLGTFDGNGYTISGIYINDASGDGISKGLFRAIDGGTIKNLGVVASYIKGGKNVGGLAGASYKGTINNSYVTGNVSGTGDYVGGLFGFFTDGGIINNSYATGNVSGTAYVGGLVGLNSYNSTISNSYATGNSYATKNELGRTFVGGLVGLNNNNSTISSSYATGNVEGTAYVGGLVGETNNSTISNSYATGIVEGNSYVGGLAGASRGGTINNSYVTGNVVGREIYFSETVGGLVGENSNNSTTVTNSYYNKETSEQSDAFKGEGKTTEEMQSKSNYVDWNFDVIWDIDIWSNNGMPYFQWQNTMRQVQVATIQDQLYTGSQITPTPEVTAPNGTKLEPGKDFDYYYGENIQVATGGTVYIVDSTNTYYGTKTVPFRIKPIKTVTITWSPPCGTATFTYDGNQQGPTPTAAGYSLEVDLETDAAIGLTAIARLIKANPDDYDDVVLQNEACTYTITPKTLEVSWTKDSVFTYNKMTQAPMPSIESEPSIELIRLNTQSAAGTYKNADAVVAEIKDQKQARNYNLTNRTKNYEIIKKGLKPYFTDTLPNFSTNKADTLWVPYEVFNDSASLHNALNRLIDYEGFATDTTKATTESDNASVLKGTPKISLQYTQTQTSPFMLYKRVETTQKATATIITEEVSADNYALTRPAIVIMSTVEEDENAGKVFCRLGNNCVEFSEAVCLAVSGQVVESCEIRVACVINNVCVPNTLLETCSLVGEIISSCEVSSSSGSDTPSSSSGVSSSSDTPSSSSEASPVYLQLSGGTFRVWQTASGVVNVDLGYMPASPAKLQIYDLKGKLIATEQVKTRFTNVRVNVPSGVYLFKSGNKMLKAAVL